ncbi:MAG: hypothetical protein ACQESR_04025 [Planctomycetota bacterium]
MTANGKTPPVERSPAEGGGKRTGIGIENRGKPGGLAALARRIMIGSGNLLATAVIVILSLTFGNQVLRWWREETPKGSGPASLAVDRLEGLGDPRRPHLLAFGDLPLSFERTVFEGTEQAALAELRAKCRALAIQFDGDRQQGLPVSDDFLRRLDESEAVEQGNGWRILQQGGPVISVVALHDVPHRTPVSKDRAPEITESVVSWGLGLRAPATGREAEASRSRWTLFTCSAHRQSVDSDLDGSQCDSAMASASDGSTDCANGALNRGSLTGGGADPPVPLPPRSQRTLGMRIQGGGGLVGFVSRERLAFNREFFEEHLEGRGWAREFGWAKMGKGLHARFRTSKTRVCDVQLQEKTDGGTRGILTLTSTAADAEQ